MGLYATTTSINLILPGFLKGNTTTSDTAGTNIFDHFITNAESKINSFIAARYDVQGFTSGSVPPLLRKLTEDIAVYNVIRSTGYRVDDKNEYLDDFKGAAETLDKLVKGELNLTYTDGSTVAVRSTTRFLSSTEGYTPIAGLDDHQNWKRDEDEIDDTSDARS
jgi:phage gp36-like protein